MAHTFKSGAFVQQCFASHPLCLTIAKLALSEQKIVLRCSSCQIFHRLRLRTSMTRSAVLPRSMEVASARGSAEHLAECAAVHPAALVVRAMDVLQDFVGLRCGECRRVYDLDVASVETHQP